MPIKWFSKRRKAADEELNSDENDKALEGKNQKGVNTPEVEPSTELSAVDAESVDRGQWTGRFDFLMSMVAYAVGLGNVWRFPYLCFKNGGGSFLVVYALFFIFAAVPIVIMEATVGQYLQRGAMEMWKMFGIGNVVIAFMCISYFCVIVSWALFYVICSFNTTFPWETCDNPWNELNCYTGKENITAGERQEIVDVVNATMPNGTMLQSSVEQFWERRVLQQTSTIDNFGGIQWELFGLMFLAWVVVYFALWKGITKARKFVYFCALFPYFLIAVLLLRGLTLPGALHGIAFYLTPNIAKLTEVTVWKDAGTQVFYSYGVGFGTLIALGSHNKFNHNCYRDAILLCFINGMTSILAGFAIFSTLGYMSKIANKPIADIVKPGVGLAFLAYPEMASNLPWLKQLCSVLFFLMITILGLDSQVCMMEGLFTALEDTFPTLLRKYKKLSLLITCIFFFILGIPMVTHAGAHWLTLVDAYGASGIALLFVVFFEVVGLAWGFGAERVRDALKQMIGKYPLPCFIILWKYTAPLSAMILFICCVVMPESLSYPSGIAYPIWAQVFAFCLSGCSMVVIPGYAIYYIFFSGHDGELTPLQRFRKGIHPPQELDVADTST
uniref:Transporter n=1 Tax=Globodera rostochiensis TaxID=31243 RepID=A0A914H3V8_GLORO